MRSSDTYRGVELQSQKIKIENIPTLFIYKDSIQEASKKGTILFYHGLTVSKEENIKELWE